jgi:cytidylate kinase
MPGVTISADYGAGGSVVAPAVAGQLGIQLLDRAISVEVAAQLHCSVEEAEQGAAKRRFADRFLSLLAPLSSGVLGAGTDAAPPDAEPVPDEAAAFREQAERIIRAALPAGAVVLGRAGAAALRDEPDVLRVRLFGPPERRLAQSMAGEQIDLETARIRMGQVDAAREHYIRRLYRVSAADPSLYHLQIDSTMISLQTCTDLIVRAYRSLVG